MDTASPAPPYEQIQAQLAAMITTGVLLQDAAQEAQAAINSALQIRGSAKTDHRLH